MLGKQSLYLSLLQLGSGGLAIYFREVVIEIASRSSISRVLQAFIVEIICVA